MKRQLQLLAALTFFTVVNTNAQSVYTYPGKTILPYTDTYDTISIASLTSGPLNSVFGLDSLTLNLTCYSDWNLSIDITSPDGKVVQLAYNLGYGSDFTGTQFTMGTTTLVNDMGSPFTGQMRPEGWLGAVNDDEVGTGNWILHIRNVGGDTGILYNWGLHFDYTPAPQPFFSYSSLPIVVINTDGQLINYWSDEPVFCHMGIIDNGPGAVNHIVDPYNGYDGHISIHVRGSSSRGFPTKSYTVETEDSTGANLDVSLLGLPSDNDWILYAPWDDKALIRDVITYGISNEMGDYASRTRLCELIRNGDYQGVYVLEEKIKRGSNRVDVHKLSSTDTAGDNLTGGYIFETDRGYSPGYDCWISNFPTCDSSGIYPIEAYVYPKKENILDVQKTYIADFVDSFETALKYGDLYDTVNGYRKYIKPSTFIDQAILQEFGHNVDGYRLSTYFYKDKDKKMHAGPIWDFNLAFGNADYTDGWLTNEFEWSLGCPDPGYNPFWYKRLLDDTTYYNDLRCRYTNLRFGPLDTNHLDYMIDSLAAILDTPQQRHYTRWPILGVWEWPNYYVGSTFGDEIDYLKSWIHGRLRWMDSTLFVPSCIDTTSTTYLASMNNPQNTRVYPNPASNELHIDGTATISKVVMYNMLGQLVYEDDRPSKNFTVPLQQYHIAPGAYSIILYNSSGTDRRKVVVSSQ